jgi:hypothetical protein
MLTVDDVEYPTFQEAAIHMGLFADESEARYALREAIDSLKTPRQLRVLFVHLLVNDCIPTPLTIWDEFQNKFAFDFLLQNNNVVDISVNRTLQELSAYLEEYGKSLSDYGLPEPLSQSTEVEHEILRWGSEPQTLAQRAHNVIDQFNQDQKAIYDEIASAITNNRGLCIFVDGQAGRGKTFMINGLCDKLRSMGHIVLATATAAFAAQLYPGGRTTHSTFKVCDFFS